MEPYDETYYLRCKEKGIDYAYYGSWQQQYAKLVVFMAELYKLDYRNKAMLDIGAACGVNLKAFKETGIFDGYYGIDISEYLIKLGKEKFNFKDNELQVADCRELPFPNNSIDFIHCSQLFEHMTVEDVDKIIKEMDRVLKTNGKVFITLNAIKKGQTKKDVFGQDPSHIIAETDTWWRTKFSRTFMVENDRDTNLKWIKGHFYPGNEEDIDPTKEGENKRRTFYDHYKNDWSVFVMTGR